MFQDEPQRPCLLGKGSGRVFGDVQTPLSKELENSKTDLCPDKAIPFDVRNSFLQEFPCLLLLILLWETLLLCLPGHPGALRALGLIFIAGDVFFGVVDAGGAAAAASPAAFTGKSHFCRTLAPIPSSLCPWPVDVFPPHQRHLGISIYYSFVCVSGSDLCRSFSSQCWQLRPSRAIPSLLLLLLLLWAVSPPPCRLCSQGCFENCIFFRDQREIRGKSRNSSCEPGGDSLLLGHSWELLVLLGWSGALTRLRDSILDVRGIFQTQTGLQSLKVQCMAGQGFGTKNPQTVGF